MRRPEGDYAMTVDEFKKLKRGDVVKHADDPRPAKITYAERDWSYDKATDQHTFWTDAVETEHGTYVKLLDGPHKIALLTLVEKAE
jgi:hypothetical protein